MSTSEEDEDVKGLEENGSAEKASTRKEEPVVVAAVAIEEDAVLELKEEVSSLKGAKTELERKRGSETAKYKEAESKWREERKVLKQRISALDQKLIEERGSALERKRKIKSYVESLDVEKARLEKEIETMRARLAEADRDRIENESKYTRALDALRIEKSQAEEGCEAAKLEAHALKNEVEDAKKAAASMKSALDELDTHKSKRLTAKSEMVALARVLEAERDRASTADKKIRDHFIPRAIDHAAALRELVSRVEDIQIKARAKSGTIASSFGNTTVTQQERNGGHHSAIQMNPMHSSASSPSGPTRSTTDEDDEHQLNHASHDTRRYGSQKRTATDSLSEALTRFDKETDRFGSGINLLNQSLDLLEDVVHAGRPCPPCLLACLDVILPRPAAHGGISRSPIQRRAAAVTGIGATGRADYAKIDHLGHHDDDDVL